MTPDSNRTLDTRFAALRLATADAAPPAATDRAIADAIARARAPQRTARRAAFRWS